MRLLLGAAAALTLTCILAAMSPTGREQTVQTQCGVHSGQTVSRKQALCVAEGVGLKRGLRDWTIGEGRDQVFDEAVWQIQSAVLETADGCGSWGMLLHISKRDGQVLRMFPVVTECSHDSVDRYPLRRPEES